MTFFGQVAHGVDGNSQKEVNSEEDVSSGSRLFIVNEFQVGR